MKYTDDILDQYINLFFFDPSKDKDSYQVACLSTENELLYQNGRYRYSPLYRVLRDVRFCFGVGKEFNPIRDKLEFPDFAGILLINLAFTNLVKKTYRGDFEEFAKNYMSIKSKKELEGLRNLRNALEHSFYGLAYYDKEQKTYYYYSVGYKYDLIEEIKFKNPPKHSRKCLVYRINPRKLYSSFVKGMNLFKQDLLKHNNPKRKYFKNILDFDSWVISSYNINS